MTDLTAAQKAKVVALARKRMRTKERLLYLYDPVNDRCMPAVCDEQGFIKIDPTELDERYVKKSGDTMTGDLEMAANIIPDANYSRYLGSSAKRWKYLYCYNILYWTLMQPSTNASIRTYLDKYIAFISTLTAGDQEVGRIHSGYWDISRAGDITGLAGKTLAFPRLRAHRAAAGNPAITVEVDGDTEPDSRLQIKANGEIVWGSGSAATDTNLYKAGLHLLATDDNFRAEGYINAILGFKDNGVAGVDGTFNDADAKVVTVSGGIITNLDT